MIEKNLAGGILKKIRIKKIENIENIPDRQ